ncbi:heme o synthase [Sphingomicrobium sp. XHP0239]|uniref:heme o synthase n=1 Tax=Sphingomicrobium maritimum TaxID=3133972 RepID=UPI0031CCB907
MDHAAESPPPVAASPRLPASASDLFALTKPRVMSLVVFTALCGLLAARAPIHPVLGFTAVLCIAVAAGASGALNMWYEADIDAKMKRTAGRPLPSGRVDRSSALHLGMGLSLFSVMVMGLATNLLAAAILAFSIFFYAVVYTMWLKPRTVQNIVIGGAAGAFPPVIGWAAVTGDVTLLPALMFAIIFLWTPPHFWALSLFVRTDYAAAGIPMLPVVRGMAETRRQILLYTFPMAVAAIAPWPLGLTGPIYGIASIALTALFFWFTVQVARNRADTPEAMGPEKTLFKYSILYLFLIFAILTIDRIAFA